MIERNQKTCKRCGESKYIYARKMCKRCDRIENPHKHGMVNKNGGPKSNWKELDPNEKPKLIEKGGFIKIKPTKKHKKAKDAERVAMEVFWNTKKDYQGSCYCEECGVSLGNQFNPYNVAHIISKGSNPAFRCDMRNFILLCADHHNQFDCAARTEMKVFEVTEEIRRRLRLEDSEKL